MEMCKMDTSGSQLGVAARVVSASQCVLPSQFQLAFSAAQYAMGMHRSWTLQRQALGQKTFLLDLGESITVAGRTARLISRHS